MDSYFGLYVAGTILFFLGLIDWAQDRTKNPAVGWSLRIFVGLVLAVYFGVKISIG